MGRRYTFILKNRAAWRAREPRVKNKKLQLPVSKIIIHKSNSKLTCDDDECDYLVRRLQKFHMTKDNKSDIKYNFLVCGNNTVYEGRGWEVEGEHAEGLDDQSIGVAFMSKYADRPPDTEELQAVKDLILLGIKKGYIAKDFKIIPHDALTDETICPGLVILEDLIRFGKDINKSANVGSSGKSKQV